jgi:hypothetical protein
MASLAYRAAFAIVFYASRLKKFAVGTKSAIRPQFKAREITAQQPFRDYV